MSIAIHNEQPLTPGQPASPLQGWRVVITRAEEQADTLAERLQALGAEPLLYPTIALVPPDDPQPLSAALQRLVDGAYDWVMLTSVNAVKFVHDYLPAPLTPGCCKVAAVGTTTRTACQELLGVEPAVVPKKFVAESLAEAMGDMRGQKVLMANANIARPALQERLQEAGADIDRVVAYCTVPATGGEDVPRLLHEGAIDAITFTSGSTVRYFLDRIGPDARDAARKTVIACIGPIAADAAHKAGLPPTVVASVYTEEGLVQALVDHATA